MMQQYQQMVSADPDKMARLMKPVDTDWTNSSLNFGNSSSCWAQHTNAKGGPSTSSLGHWSFTQEVYKYLAAKVAAKAKAAACLGVQDPTLYPDTARICRRRIRCVYFRSTEFKSTERA
jgi:hypothetical protein